MGHDDRDDRDGSAKKRRRGATRLSCAECRRLKLRCDREVPCSSCRKRGCSAICPDGSLTTGLGNRFVLASTQDLHVKISELSNRVRSLEDALRSAHGQLSNEPHPLLHDELLKIKHPLQRDTPASAPGGSAPAETKEESPDAHIVDAVGSLSVTDSGRTKYFGHAANSYYFLHNEDADTFDLDDRLPAVREILSPSILSVTGTFPASLLSGPQFQATKDSYEQLYLYLPPADKAAALRDTYYSYAAWMYNPIPIDQFQDEIFNWFYETTPGTAEDSLLGHRFAVLFMVLAIGSQVDPSLPAHNIDAETYHQLARAALFGSRLVDQPTTRAVQALYLMVYYQFLEDPFTSTSNSRWTMMGMAVKLAQSIGLHRDSGKFGLQPLEAQRRRDLFSELYVYDSWMALTLGRPPSISAAHYDIPGMTSEQAADPANAGSAYSAWKYAFTNECLNALHDQAFGASMPSYKVTMQLDRKLRAHPVPPVLQIAGFGSENPVDAYPESPMLTLQRHTVVLIRESNLLYLHRSFFARAISDHPDDPLGSPYGTSVIAAYRSAWSLIALVRNLHATLKHPTERLWFVWANLFSCVIILGSIVTRCPSLTLAPSALVQLDSACDLFAKVAAGFRADKVLSVMMRLREKAHASLAHFRAGKTPGGAVGAYSLHQVDSEVDELSALGGRTRLITRSDATSSSPASMVSPALTHLSASALSPTTATRVVPVPLYPESSAQQVHPSVLEYMRTFAPASAGGAPSKAPQPQDAYHSPPTPAHAQPPTSGHAHHHASSSAGSAYEMLQMQLPQQPPSPPQPAYVNMTPSGAIYPQYFPVFDYGPAGGESAFAPLSAGDMTPPGGVEDNPHTTWNTFVAQLGM